MSIDKRKGAFESYGDYNKRVKCEYAYTLRYPGGGNGCYDNSKEKRVRIIYTSCGDEDVLGLCNGCAKKVKKSAKKNGYKVEIKNL